jgi:hypothetical protein
MVTWKKLADIDHWWDFMVTVMKFVVHTMAIPHHPNEYTVRKNSA